MSQVLHIFKKDARHLWAEIVISFALTIAFVRFSFRGVSSLNLTGSTYLPVLAALLAALVPVSWWILCARLIHDESLVGENQFWITRPYQWEKLLAAKGLFLVTFLYLPILIAQTILLAAAGFHPAAWLPGLFYNLVLLTGVLVLPIAVIATVTSNFARLVLTLLGAVVYLGLIIWALTFVHPPDPAGFSSPYEGKLTFALFFFVCLLVIVLQYATRHIWRSRWILLGLPFLVAACSVAWPIPTVVRHLYPPLAASEQPPAQLAFDPDPERQSSVNPSHQRSRVDLYIPLTVSGISSDGLVNNQAIQVSVEAPNGLRWNSKWRRFSNYYRPDTSRSMVDIPIDEKFLDQVKAAPVTVTFNFALIQLRAGATVTNQLGDEDFSIDSGVCSFLNPPGVFIECRFSMGDPGLAYVTTRWNNGPCSRDPLSSPSGTLKSVWVGAIDPPPAELGLDPVKVKELAFQGFSRSETMCPGTPITVTPYTVVRRVQTILTIPNLDLTKYTIDRLDETKRMYAHTSTSRR